MDDTVWVWKRAALEICFQWCWAAFPISPIQPNKKVLASCHYHYYHHYITYWYQTKRQNRDPVHPIANWHFGLWLWFLFLRGYSQTISACRGKKCGLNMKPSTFEIGFVQCIPLDFIHSSWDFIYSSRPLRGPLPPKNTERGLSRPQGTW